VERAAVGQKCAECASPAEGSEVHTAADLRPGGRGAPVSYGIIGAAVAVFVLGMVSRDALEVLFVLGAQANQAVAAGQWYRLGTAAFLHADLMHILFNMWALSLFGPPLERDAGSGPFAAMYAASALAGGAAFYVLGDPGGVAVGASGAIFGLFGAWLAGFWRHRHTAAGRAGLNQLLLLLGINAALPLLIPRIAWQAHLGGFLAGILIATVWGSLARSGRGPWARVVVALVVAAAALAAVVVT
jgi:membrane associated rhomboid family serine protease